MNTKYRYKPLSIDAIQFSATPQGIAAIAVFGGADFTGVNLNGNPLPAAYVNGLVVPEGSWLIRNASGMYKVLKDSVFTAVCEREPESVAASALYIEAAEEPALEEIVVDDTPKVISREQAIEQNLTRYFLGTPCVHGHVDERYTLNMRCITCQTLSSDASRQRAKRKAAQKVYNARSYEKRKAVISAAQFARNMGA